MTALRSSHVSRLASVLQRLEDRVVPAINLTIGANGATVGVNAFNGSFTPQSPGAFLNVGDIAAALAAGHDVLINTGGLGSEPGHLTWSSDAVLNYGTDAGQTLRLSLGDFASQGMLTFNGAIRPAVVGAGNLEIVINADRVVIDTNAVLHAGNAGVTLAPRTSGVSIDINAPFNEPTRLQLDSSELHRIQAGIVRIGGLGPEHTPATPLMTWGIDIHGPVHAPSGWDRLSLFARGRVQEVGEGSITVEALAVGGWRGVHLASPFNEIGTIAGATNAHNFTIVSSTKLTVGSVDGLTGIRTGLDKVERPGGDVFISAPLGLRVEATIDTRSGSVGSFPVLEKPNVDVFHPPILGAGRVRMNAGGIPAVGTDRLTTPLVWSSEAIAIDPINNFFDELFLTVDEISNTQKVTMVFNNPNETPQRITTLFRYDEFLRYNFMHADGKLIAYSTSDSLFGSIYTDSMLTGRTFTIGATLLEEALLVQPSGSRELTTFRRIGSQMIPDSIKVMMQSQMTNYLEYRNFRTLNESLGARLHTLPDATNGYVQVLSPSAGAPVEVGVKTNIRFQAGHRSAALVAADVYLATDNGLTFDTVLALGLISSELAPLTGQYTYQWTPTADQESSSARIRVMAHFDDGSSAVAESLTDFAVRPLVNGPFVYPSGLAQAFTTQMIVIDPINNFFDEQTITFNEELQGQFVAIQFNNPNETPLRVGILLRPDIGTSWRMSSIPGTPPEMILAFQPYNILFNSLDFPDESTSPFVGQYQRVGEVLDLIAIETELYRDVYSLLRNVNSIQPITVESKGLHSPNSLSVYTSYFNYSDDPGTINPTDFTQAQPGATIYPLTPRNMQVGRQTDISLLVHNGLSTVPYKSIAVQLSLDGGMTYDIPIATITRFQFLEEIVVPFTPSYEHATESARLRFVADFEDGSTLVQEGFQTFRIPVEPPSLVVTTLDDRIDAFDGVNSLREALLFAGSSPDANTITFDPTLFAGPQILRLRGAALRIGSDVVIRGPGSAWLTLHGNNASEVFSIVGGSIVLEGLAFSGGSNGAIDLLGGSLTVRDAVFLDNSAAGNGGAIRTASDTDLAIIASTFSRNLAQATGGAIFNGGETRIVNSTFFGNVSLLGGAILNAGQLTVLNATLTANRALMTDGGGGIANDGTAFLANTLVVGNFAGVVEAANDLRGDFSGSEFNLIGSISAAGGLREGVAGNRVGDGKGNNLSAEATLVLLTRSTLPPRGGLPLLSTSRAVNAGTNSRVSLSVDQFGNPRISGGLVDIGAAELPIDSPRIPPVTPSAPPPSVRPPIVIPPPVDSPIVTPLSVNPIVPPSRQPILYRVVGMADGPGRVRAFAADGSIVFDGMVFESSFTGGVRVAAGDISGDGIDDILTVAGMGGGPRIRIFDGASGAVLYDFFAFEESFRGGLFIAAGDLNGDGYSDYVVGAGRGGGPRVSAFDGRSSERLLDFFAFAVEDRLGVTVALGDPDGDGVSELIVGQASGGSRFRVFTAAGELLWEASAYEEAFQGGVFLAVGDFDGDGRTGVVTAPGIGGGPRLREFQVDGSVSRDEFLPDATVTGGLSIGRGVVVGTSGRLIAVTTSETTAPFGADYLGGLWVG